MNQTIMSKIHNIHTLDNELQHLKKKARELETKLDHNTNDLRHNFGEMAWNSLLGSMREQNIVAGVADRLFHSSKLQDSVFGFVEKLTERISGFFNKAKEKVS